jgi:hypothetical protein
MRGSLLTLWPACSPRSMSQTVKNMLEGAARLRGARCGRRRRARCFPPSRNTLFAVAGPGALTAARGAAQTRAWTRRCRCPTCRP